MSTARGGALAALLLLTGCSNDGGDAASPQPTASAAPSPGTASPSPAARPDAPEPGTEDAPPPQAQPTAAPGPAEGPCEQDAAARRTCTFVEAVLTGAVSTLTPPEQDVAARTSDLPPAPWGLSGCDLVGDVTVECQVLFSPPRQQEVVATFVLQPVDGGYAVTDYLGLL